MAHLYTGGLHLGKPSAHLNTTNDLPFVVMRLGDIGGAAIHLNTTGEARDLMGAAFRAWRLLNPDGPLDALISELLDEPDRAKIRARIREQKAAEKPCRTPALHRTKRCMCYTITWTDTAAAEQAAQDREQHAAPDTAQPVGEVPPELVFKWQEGTSDAVAEQFAAPDEAQPADLPEPAADATGCPECGAVGLPRHEDGTCRNAAGCRERQAAKASAR
jgi:hypothetical protein